MEHFFVRITPKPQATNSDRLVYSIINVMLAYIQLIPMMAVVGYGFRLGFGS